MMGQLGPAQNALIYNFCLDRHIPPDHLLRQIDRFLDFSEIREHLSSSYSHTGRPSVDPELMIRMLVIGYCYGIRSERRLCDEVNFNLAYRWFCRLGLEDEVPDHSTFSKNRHGRFRESKTFRLLFDHVVKRCIEEGLVKGEGFAIDASYIDANVSRQRYVRGNQAIDWGSPDSQTRAVREYLEALDQDPSLRRPQKSISMTDPMAQWSGAKGPANFYYSTNYLVDVEEGIIVDVEASPSTIKAEMQTTRTMIERTEQTHQIKPDRLMADVAYGKAANLGYLVEEKDIEPHIPVWDKSERSDGTFSRSDFTWIDEENEYLCPRGQRLRSTGYVTPKDTLLYRSRVGDCADCPDKPRCCPNTPYRKIPRSIHERARDLARAICDSEEYRNHSFNLRKKVEMRFGHMKQILNFRRLRLRGLHSANDEFLLVATAQNLRSMARIRGRAPPEYRGSVPAMC